MKSILGCLSLVASSALQALAAYSFVPDNTGLQIDKYVSPLPVQYELADSQAFKPGVSSSYWASSYIQGSDGHQYLVISHFITIDPPGIAVRRASILDVTNPSYYNQSSTVGVPPPSVDEGSAGVNVIYDDYGFVSTTADPLGRISMYSTNPASTFNITFSLSTPVILNGGQGSFLWEDVIANQWSMPTGTTTGSLTVDGAVITIDSKKSFTWYDRQFQSSGASEWTWFALHTTSAITKARKTYSIWFSPDGHGGTKGFATVRDKKGVQSVVAAKLTTRGSPWPSPASGIEYATEWNVSLADDTSLNIKVLRKDQEMVDPQATQSTYEGFVNVSGIGVSGYGVVEIQPPVNF